MVSGVVCGYGLLGFARIQGWQKIELGWPEFTGMELAVAPTPSGAGCCGASQELRAAALGSWGPAELTAVLKCELWPRLPRWPHGWRR